MDRDVNQELGFAICHDDKKLEHFGVGNSENFDIFMFSEVMAFAEYEVQNNDLLVIANRVVRQIRGVAIGGTLIDIYQEHQFLTENWRRRRQTLQILLSPDESPFSLFASGTFWWVQWWVQYPLRHCKRYTRNCFV